MATTISPTTLAPKPSKWPSAPAWSFTPSAPAPSGFSSPRPIPTKPPTAKPISPKATKFSRTSPKKPAAAPSIPITSTTSTNPSRTSATSSATNTPSPTSPPTTSSTASTTKSASKSPITRATKSAPAAATSPKPTPTSPTPPPPPPGKQLSTLSLGHHLSTHTRRYSPPALYSSLLGHAHHSSRSRPPNHRPDAKYPRTHFGRSSPCLNKPSRTLTTFSAKRPAAPPSSITPSRPPGSSS